MTPLDKLEACAESYRDIASTVVSRWGADAFILAFSYSTALSLAVAVREVAPNSVIPVLDEMTERYRRVYALAVEKIIKEEDAIPFGETVAAMTERILSVNKEMRKNAH